MSKRVALGLARTPSVCYRTHEADDKLSMARAAQPPREAVSWLPRSKRSAGPVADHREVVEPYHLASPTLVVVVVVIVFGGATHTHTHTSTKPMAVVEPHVGGGVRLGHGKAAAEATASERGRARCVVG